MFAVPPPALKLVLGKNPLLVLLGMVHGELHLHGENVVGSVFTSEQLQEAVCLLGAQGKISMEPDGVGPQFLADHKPHLAQDFERVRQLVVNKPDPEDVDRLGLSMELDLPAFHKAGVRVLRPVHELLGPQLPPFVGFDQLFVSLVNQCERKERQLSPQLALIFLRQALRYELPITAPQGVMVLEESRVVVSPDFKRPKPTPGT